MFLYKGRGARLSVLLGAGTIVAGACAAGALWFDLPAYLFLRRLDWAGWKFFDVAFDSGVWLWCSGAMTVPAVAAYHRVGRGKKGIENKKESNRGSARLAGVAVFFGRPGQLVEAAADYTAGFMRWLDCADSGKGRRSRFAHRVFRAAPCVFLSVLSAFVATGMLKYVIGRMRPVFFDALGQVGFVPFTNEWAFNSMPSGHAAAGFAGLCAIGAMFPRARWWALVLAAAIGISRVCVGAHFPSDVILGAFIGLCAASWVGQEFLQKCSGRGTRACETGAAS
jgi:membrane-associated phospholipid phosphatase